MARTGGKPRLAQTLAPPSKIVENLKHALCHPRRPHHQDGMCVKCFARESVPKATRDAGMAVADIKKYNELVAMHEGAEHIERLAKTANAILQEHLPEYAQLHLEAAKIAAADGDSRPAEWALTHVKAGKTGKPVAEPPAKAATGGESGVKVFIGLRMGEMPDAITIEAEQPEDGAER